MGKETIIYISSQNIQILNGSCDKDDVIRLLSYTSLPIQEGAMINGVITDDTQIKEALEQLANEGIHECRLIVDSGQILTKNIAVPLLNRKQLYQFTKDELSDIDTNHTDLIYDYCILRNAKGKERNCEILCCGAERKLIGSYIDLFTMVNIKIKSIDISINAVHKLTQEMPELQHKTFVISILDGNNVSSFLFVDNHYSFSNRSRLFSDRGTDAFATEMSWNISQLLQFHKAQNYEQVIDTVYFCNLDESEEETIYPRIEESLTVKAQRFPTTSIIYIQDPVMKREFDLHKYILPMGGIIRK